MSAIFDSNLSRTQRRLLKKVMEKENSKWPDTLVELDPENWPNSVQITNLRRVLRSRLFLVQIFEEPPPVLVRLSICRSSVDGDTWKDGISWEQLQNLKEQAGYGDMDAVEIYPCERDTVNVANMRHLWVLREQLPFAWRSKKRQAQTA